MKRNEEQVSIREVYELVDGKFNKLDKKIDDLMENNVNPLSNKLSNLEGRAAMISLLVSVAIASFSIIVNLIIKK